MKPVQGCSLPDRKLAYLEHYLVWREGAATSQMAFMLAVQGCLLPRLKARVQSVGEIVQFGVRACNLMANSCNL